MFAVTRFRATGDDAAALAAAVHRCWARWGATGVPRRRTRAGRRRPGPVGAGHPLGRRRLLPAGAVGRRGEDRRRARVGARPGRAGRLRHRLTPPRGPRRRRPTLRSVASRTRSARHARKRKRRMDRVEHDLSAEQWAALKEAWGGCAYCGATGKPLQRDCVLPSPAAGATRSTTSLRPAARATPASATTRSPAGCGASGSTSAPSSSATSRSRRDPRRAVPLRRRGAPRRSPGLPGGVARARRGAPPLGSAGPADPTSTGAPFSMTDSPRPVDAETPSGVADPTRDIRLPALPDRPPSVLPREWSDLHPPSAASGSPAPSSSGDEPAAHGASAVDLQTDELEPPRGRSRERTIAFVSPEMARGRPMPTVARTPRRRRRWPWIVLALLPLVVIIVSGLWWLLLLRATSSAGRARPKTPDGRRTTPTIEP